MCSRALIQAPRSPVKVETLTNNRKTFLVVPNNLVDFEELIDASCLQAQWTNMAAENCKDALDDCGVDTRYP